MTTESRNRGLEVASAFLSGLLIAIIVAWLAYPHDIATRQDIKDLQSGIQSELTVLTQQVNAQQIQLNAESIDMARLKEKEHISQ